jgi:hypothetical protein
VLGMRYIIVMNLTLVTSSDQSFDSHDVGHFTVWKFLKKWKVDSNLFANCSQYSGCIINILHRRYIFYFQGVSGTTYSKCGIIWSLSIGKNVLGCPLVRRSSEDEFCLALQSCLKRELFPRARIRSLHWEHILSNLTFVKGKSTHHL